MQSLLIFSIWFRKSMLQDPKLELRQSTLSTKKSVTTMLTYPWKCTVLHCNHLGNTGKPLVLMTRHFDYCPSASEGDNQSVGSSAPVVSRCFPGGYNVKLYISRGRLAWWLLTFLCSVTANVDTVYKCFIATHTCSLCTGHVFTSVYCESVEFKQFILMWGKKFLIKSSVIKCR